MSFLLIDAIVVAATLAPGAWEQGGTPETTPSGGVYRLLKEGSGPSPAAGDTVRVSYRSAGLPTAPVEASLERMNPCMSESLQRMKVGGRAYLSCPMPPDATLALEVELLGIKER